MTTILALILVGALATPALCEEKPIDPAEVLSAVQGQAGNAGGIAGNAAGVVGKVEKIALGSTGATVTLNGGKQVKLDFTGLSGVTGGPNYVGWGMVLFGMSIVTRMLSTVSRILRPFAPRRRSGEYIVER